MSKPRLLYITQWFEPEPAFKGLAFASALSAHGFDVEVLTGFPNYPGGHVYPPYRLRPYLLEQLESVEVHRVWLYPSHSQSSFGRIANYLSFFFSVLIFGLLRGRNYDAIYVYHPPLTPALAATVFTRIWRRPYLVEIQDLWPDTVFASGMVPPFIARLIAAACRFVYQRAALVVAQSKGMADRLMADGVPEERLTTLYNWATYCPADTPHSMPTTPQALFSGCFNVVYGGNLGQAQALESLVAAAGAASTIDRRIRLHLFGDGISRKTLVELVKTVGNDAVYIHDPESRSAMDRVFDSADALILQLKNDPLYQITIPSKLQHYLACGKPIIAALSGEAAEIAAQSGGAIVVPPENVPEIQRAMVQLASMTVEQRTIMGNKGRAYYERTMAFDQAIARTAAMISCAIGDYEPRSKT
jgi:colanic acid biosynthesis glycosyl transferase WcaI